jgi:hypothetical protein
MFLDAGQAATFEEWANEAILDAPGRKGIQNYLRQCKEDHHRINIHQLLDRSPSRAVPEDDIRLLAYYKWEAAARPEGDGVQFWLDAENDLRQCR